MAQLEVIGLIVAALGGAAVGVERQWSGHASGPEARFAGVRTFTMLGGLAGLAGWMWIAGLTLPALILLGGAVAIVAAGYVAASRHDVDGTTEVAALVVLAAGVLAGIGYLRLASGVIAIAVLLLVEKSRLHAAVHRIDDLELRAGVRFAVMALVVLPLVPTGPYGPYGAIRPREVWMLVLFFSGLSFVGHILRRNVGPGRGYLVSGLAAGLVSSTNVTFTFARLSRSDPHAERPLAFGAVAANAVLYPRVLAATAVLNAPLVPVLLPYLVAPALIAMAIAAAGARRPPAPDEGSRVSASSNPLQLSSALQMAALFQFVLVLVSLARDAWGQAGVLTTAMALGLTDVDALTVSMAREVARTASLEAAALAIAVGIVSNTVMKTVIALALGSRAFRSIVATTLVGMIVAAVLSIAFLR